MLSESRELDPELKSNRILDFEQELSKTIIGQSHIILELSNIYQSILSNFREEDKPIDSVILLGRTGVGKTSIVKNFAEILTGNKKSIFRIDCGEYKNESHIAKLLGAPPSYVGHKESKPLLTQENIDKYKTYDFPVTIVLLDEIEKATPVLFDLFLNILDEGKVKNNLNQEVDFTNCVIFMTSNLGVKEIDKEHGALGFDTNKRSEDKIIKCKLEDYFPPEFLNRIGKTLIFNPLSDQDILKITNKELKDVQNKLSNISIHSTIRLNFTEEVKLFLLKEGFSTKYGARYLQRTIHKNIMVPLSRLYLTKQFQYGDTITISIKDDKIIFLNDPIEINNKDADSFLKFIKS